MKKIVVLGGGPGGYSAALDLAKLGQEVVLIEKNHFGGTCLNAGCIPTKAFVQATHIYQAALQANAYGIELMEAPKIDFTKTLKYKNKTVAQLRNGIKYLLKKNGVTVINGIGRLLDTHTLEVTAGDEKKTVTADVIIIATGSREIEIRGFETDGHQIVNSTQMLDIAKLPESCVIIGGGVIGVEFASILNRFGKKVTIVEMMNRLIPAVDEEVSAALRGSLEKNGVRILTETKANRIVCRSEDTVTIEVEHSDQSTELLEAEKVMVCIGRRANIEDIGLETVGVATSGRYIYTNDKMQTNVPNIYAIGDVTDSLMLAHVAYHEARIAALHIAGRETPQRDIPVPSCIFSYPEVAAVGLSETEAREAYKNILIQKASFLGNGKALIERENDGFIKVVMKEDGTPVGISLIGPKATELIAEPTMAVSLGIDMQRFAAVIHAHPSLAEILGDVALGTQGLDINE